MTLTADEADFMREGGTGLHTIIEAHPDVDWSEVAIGLKPEAGYKPSKEEQESLDKIRRIARRLKKGQGYYILRTDCGYLQDVDGWLQCRAHEDERRPTTCQTFEMGSGECLVMRVARGVNTIEEVGPVLVKFVPGLKKAIKSGAVPRAQAS
jgi:hypothetical protein